MSTEQEIAWAAGLFEGEGCLNSYARKGKGSRGVQVRLAMTDRDAVDRFAAIVGVGSVHGPRIKKAGQKPIFEWYVQDATEVQQVIELLLPWLCARRSERAREVLAATAGIQPRNGERTHCPQGHPYEGENLRIEVRKTGVARICRECSNRRARERARRRLGVTPDRYRV